ncbi:MAG: phosphoenolpyruvate carboxykinase [Coxiellaceae bacterium]|nr:phosphoenolpyruvate carboxykinase [Coxiellaceae bacterium]
MSALCSATQQQNLTVDELLEQALTRGEGVIAANGAFCVATGERTGRSPKDRFIIRDELTDNTIEWGTVNQPMTPLAFNALWARAEDYMQQRETFVSALHVGADPEEYLPVEVQTEMAWHNIFCQNLFIRPLEYNPKLKSEWKIINATHMPIDPTNDNTNSEALVAIDMTQRKVLVCGTQYAGEMKKAMFTVLNYFLPAKGILPMHCAANVGGAGDVSLFFGLSGTGKTTLSADPERFLMGDDEHGWGDHGTFNFEGGCYAKCIDLSAEREPVIWKAIKHGSVMENVVLDANKQPDYSDGSLTLNTRAAYPRDYIEKCVASNQGTTPSSVIFLTCDLYGVLPPVALLDKQQAAYYFLSGYTALVGSTEVGAAKGISPTFSTCFGAPFFPRPATEYAELLMKHIEKTGCKVFLVNTGWCGGAYGAGGERFSIPTTRAVVSAIHSGQLNDIATDTLPGFNLAIPYAVDGVDTDLLDPRKSCQNAKDYQQQLNKLIGLFQQNFTRFDVPEEIKHAGPTAVE